MACLLTIIVVGSDTYVALEWLGKKSCCATVKSESLLGIPGELIPGHPQMPKSVDAQVPYKYADVILICI
jgi:hypothetical protein